MERAAYILKVKPGSEAAYLDAHHKVWPDLIAAARDAGFRNHTVFMRSRTVFLYVEADDIARASIEYLKHPVKLKWDQYMSEYLDNSPDDQNECAPGELTAIFHFD